MFRRQEVYEFGAYFIFMDELGDMMDVCAYKSLKKDWILSCIRSLNQ